MLDLEAVRAELPVTRIWTYLNHAAIAPISRHVRRAAQALLKDAEENGTVNHAVWTEAVRKARRSAAQMLNVHLSENGKGWRSGRRRR